MSITFKCGVCWADVVAPTLPAGADWRCQQHQGRSARKTAARQTAKPSVQHAGQLHQIQPGLFSGPDRPLVLCTTHAHERGYQAGPGLPNSRESLALCQFIEIAGPSR